MTMPELVLEKLSWRKDWMEEESVNAAGAVIAMSALTKPRDTNTNRPHFLIFML